MLALPALAVQAAAQSSVLVNAAVVGRLGIAPLASLAVGGAVLAVVGGLSTMLAHGTTGRAARWHGADVPAAAAVEGVQAAWLALSVGVATTVAVQIGAQPLAQVLAGGPGEVAAGAALWLRVASLGVPGSLLTMAGIGWMRGVQDTRRPLVYTVEASVLSTVLCLILVHPLELGLLGSAVSAAAAQTLSGAMCVRALAGEGVELRPRGELIRSQLAFGRNLFLRDVAFQVCFISAAVVAARLGPAALGAHHVVLKLWLFCILALESVAIAAQSLIGADLGAGQSSQARGTALLVGLLGGVCGLGFAVVLGAGATGLVGLFTTDRAVLNQALAAWPWLVIMLPLAGVVLALEGVLTGAGDLKYLRNLSLVSVLGVFLPAIWLTHTLHLGLGGIWVGLTLFFALRLVALVPWLIRGRWTVVGDPAVVEPR
ncbi:MATE family efflux transporter [Streptomyces roseus]|uniref:MATE family efflux transporter n=1 Tax=Streptomyces roseus TaxID=66430 RepID=UPI00381073F5